MSNQEQVLNTLGEIFSEIIMRDGITLTMSDTPETVEGWDSACGVEILLLCEEQFDIRFSSAEIDRIRNVGDIVDFVMGKLPA